MGPAKRTRLTFDGNLSMNNFFSRTVEPLAPNSLRISASYSVGLRSPRSQACSNWCSSVWSKISTCTLLNKCKSKQGLSPAAGARHVANVTALKSLMKARASETRKQSLWQKMFSIIRNQSLTSFSQNLLRICPTGYLRRLLPSSLRLQHQQGSLLVNPATLKIAHSGPLSIASATWLLGV